VICRGIIFDGDECSGAAGSRAHRRCLPSTVIVKFENLAQQITSRVTGGVLPREEPLKTERLYGSEMACDGCDHVILPAQTEYRLQLKNGQTYRLHLACYGLWEAARRLKGWADRAPRMGPGRRRPTDNPDRW
jgi:hypothetical protein